MNNTAKIQIRSVYGVDHVYPFCEAGKLFAEIAGSKTLTSPTINRIRRLGYRIVEVDRFGGSVGELVAVELDALKAHLGGI